ncbi:aspartyl/asparaginyl beta-hydroxylase domain-containing protein [Streptomyces roseicoloratus]|uniref:Aspartyl/asparaginyl beta-hydroxylase domain-containing protein n=1 Tax=Streptomyces roseicoloratus TaxID=2508722 RepID=A0ABY9RNC9_9ACTN|nr:aspartyl/asparaginyl beta-hydroxylase domain-containing protein [Streptomyces roseicoloratus]WMX43704.1 aspartyl/asparaginyl beta-hydroxylase domain-containing protein [Streptomyces roseicoloratus]
MSGLQRIHDPQGRSLPNAVGLGPAAGLGPDVDLAAMRAEVDALTRGGAPLAVAEGRRVLPLRSPGGDPHRTDTAGPGLEGFAPTPWCDRLPALRAFLAALPAPLRAVRLMALAPGAVLKGLGAAKNGPPWGLCRLHLPIVSGPGTKVVFPDGSHRWDPGGLWFSAAWRRHALVNDPAGGLVHLVVDLHHTAAVAELFPEALRPRLRSPAALERRREIPLAPAELARHACRFALPESFANWEQPGHLLPHRLLRGVVAARLVPHHDTLLLVMADRPFCALEHIGDGEFRLRGWSDERTLQVTLDTGRPTGVVVRAREGANTYVTSLPAAPPA